MLTDEQRKRLNAKMPPEEVATRKGGGGKTLSYIEGWRAIDLMNEIVGAGAWGYECEAKEEWRELLDDGDKGKRWHVSHSARCRVTIVGCEPISDYGVGHGVERDLGAAIESSLKEAATDALKRCLKSYGNRMGLALYDKEQRNVGVEPHPVSNEATILIGMLSDDTDRAKKLIRDGWSKFSAADRAALKDAIEAGKQKAA